jgi:hypothetical protein
VKRICLGLVLMASSLWAKPAVTLTPGTYTNEEQVYFDKEAGRVPPPWIGIVITRAGSATTITSVDAFGKPANAEVDANAVTEANNGTITATLKNGLKTTLRLARSVTCWGSVPRIQKKADGNEDWYFIPGLKLHDQGGRVRFGGGDTGAPEYILRLRNVIFATGTNRPSIVLYVHTPKDPDRAISYVWGDPDVSRLGVNLRTMQASCTISKGEMK